MLSLALLLRSAALPLACLPHIPSCPPLTAYPLPSYHHACLPAVHMSRLSPHLYQTWLPGWHGTWHARQKGTTRGRQPRLPGSHTVWQCSDAPDTAVGPRLRGRACLLLMVHVMWPFHHLTMLCAFPWRWLALLFHATAMPTHAFPCLQRAAHSQLPTSTASAVPLRPAPAALGETDAASCNH